MELFSRMLLAVRQAGIVASELQGRVSNERKVVAVTLPNDSDMLRARRAAKTVVDDIVQEIIILAALDVLDPNAIALDAEEVMPSCKAFAVPGEADTTLVIDPIDGTLEYLANRESYSVCVAMTSFGALNLAFIFFPAQDIIYYLDESGRAKMASGCRENGIRDAKFLQGEVKHDAKIVYVNGRVPESVQHSLTAAGYRVVDDSVDGLGANGCMLACLRGDAVAYISHTRQMRDIMLGGLIAATSEGYAVDWTGAALQWPSGGRVPRAIFGVGDVPAPLLECVRSAVR